MKRIYWILVGLLGVQLFFLVNLQFTAWPEMFSYSYLFNNDFGLYRDMVFPYPPVLPLLLALLYRIFGYGVWVVKGFSWSLALMNSVFIFLVARKLTKKDWSGVVGVVFYILTSTFLEGNMLWFDTAVVTPILVATYFLSDRKYFWGGLALATAALIKQTTGIFIIFGILYLMYEERDIRRVLEFLIGPVVLGVLLLMWLLVDGSLVHFLNWTLYFPAKYWTSFPGYVQMGLDRRELGLLAFLGVPVMGLLFNIGKKFEKRYVLLILFWVLSLVMIYPRFSFFHGQALIAMSAIFFGIMSSRLKKEFVGIYLLTAFLAIAKPVMAREWGRDVRFWGEGDIQLTKKIQQEVGEKEGLYLLGRHSGYYVMADRLPPKPWVDNYGWYYAPGGFGESVLSEWETNSPEYVFWQEAEEGQWWELGTFEPESLTKWIKENYTRDREIEEGLWLWQKNN